MDKKAFRNLSYGVYTVTAWGNGRPTGCTANSAMQITSSPATIAVSINHDNYTNSVIKELGKFAIAIIAEDSDATVIGRFGFMTGRDTDKFDGVPYTVRGMMPIPDTACAYICCNVIDKMETATHTVFLGEVTDAGVTRSATPMTYAYYHNVIKGTTPKNAPTATIFEGQPKN